MTTTVGAGAPSFTPLHCARCGARSLGRYCSSCGSALADGRDLSVKHFLREAVAAITDLDSALIGSFRALILRPGELTAAYLRGDRHRYLPPFRVFLFCNVLYFVAVAQLGVTVLTAPLAMQMDEMTYRDVTRAVMVKRYPALTQSATEGQRARRAAMQVSLTARRCIGSRDEQVVIPSDARDLQFAWPLQTFRVYGLSDLAYPPLVG